MTEHGEQLPRPAAELERLAGYYDSHDTSGALPPEIADITERLDGSSEP